jgi:hypothetical protein
VFGEMPAQAAGVVAEHGPCALSARFGGFLSHVIGTATSLVPAAAACLSGGRCP